MVQFLNTVTQILNSDSVRPLDGICRHLAWQSRRLFRRFPVMLRIGDSRLRVDQPCGVAALINAMGEYDHNNMGFFRSMLSHTKGTFVDIGANIGSYTLIVSEVSDATVISIEPHPVTFGWLSENVRLNGRHNVTCLGIVLSNRDGHLQFTDGTEPSINHIAAYNELNKPGITVNSRRLETLCDDLQVTPDFVKIDVEGHELCVLEGFGKYRSLPKVVVVENGEEKDVREWMIKADFVDPLFVHIDKRVLSHVKQRRPEDPVYLNRSFLNELRSFGFTISA